MGRECSNLQRYMLHLLLCDVSRRWGAMAVTLFATSVQLQDPGPSKAEAVPEVLQFPADQRVF